MEHYMIESFVFYDENMIIQNIISGAYEKYFKGKWVSKNGNFVLLISLTPEI